MKQVWLVILLLMQVTAYADPAIPCIVAKMAPMDHSFGPVRLSPLAIELNLKLYEDGEHAHVGLDQLGNSIEDLASKYPEDCHVPVYRSRFAALTKRW